MSGRLELIIGCMYSGKTTELIRLIDRYRSINKNMMILNYIQDTRYGDDNKIYTHSKLGVEAIHLDSLMSIFMDPQLKKLYQEAEIIFINEGQFFGELFQFCLKSVDLDNKTVVVCGLDGDFERKPFGDILNLIPHSDKITRLTAMCKICNNGTPGIFTCRTIDSKEQTLIGGDESYMPVCRKHYNEKIEISKLVSNEVEAN